MLQLHREYDLGLDLHAVATAVRARLKGRRQR
jgi:hypothetical protein